MPDGLTEQERAAIRRAEDSGAVEVLPPGRRPVRSPSGERADHIAARREQVRRLTVEDGLTVARIAQRIGCSPATVQADRAALGLVQPRGPNRKRGPGELDKASAKKKARADAGAAKVSDRWRFKVQPVPMGEPRILVPRETNGTIFPDRVFEPDGAELVLKDGCNNAKIGGDVLVGRLKGAYIATLTLEERATCPTTCAMWRGCYGNVMPHSRRWNGGEALERQIIEEVGIACDKNEKVLIRLHILGDFYSEAYLQVWADLLDRHPNLYVFGFTAWDVDTPIGRGVAWLRKHAPDRFMVRTSGRTGKWGSFTLPFPTEAKMIGDAIVCPEQLDAMKGSPEGKHCGNCAACWSCDRPIAFIEH